MNAALPRVTAISYRSPPSPSSTRIADALTNPEHDKQTCLFSLWPSASAHSLPRALPPELARKPDPETAWPERWVTLLGSHPPSKPRTVMPRPRPTSQLAMQTHTAVLVLNPGQAALAA